MEDVFVGRVMTTAVHTVARDEQIIDAAERMRERNIGSLLIVDESGDLDGILTATDFVSLVADGHAEPETPVSEVMSTDVVTTGANDRLREVARTMLDGGFHHVPVVDETEGVLGMVTTTDLTGYLANVQSGAEA
ncbi:MAG: CBS domain-containing protein [Haloarculaceae archaeon]